MDENELLIRDYLRYQTRQGCKEVTLRNYRSQLNKFLREMKTFDVTRSQCLRWVEGSSNSPNTRSNRLDILRVFYRWAAQTERLSEDPLERDKSAPRKGASQPRVLLTRAQVLDALESEAGPVRCFVALSAFQGMSCGEIAKLEVGDVRLDGNQPWVRTKKTASGRPRSEQLHRLSVEAFRQLPMPPGGRIFPETDGQRVSHLLIRHMKDISASSTDLIYWYRAQVDVDGLGFDRGLLEEPSADGPLRVTELEGLILVALYKQFPDAASAYRQSLFDIGDDRRISFRGPIQELRETLVEVLNVLAPDDEVMAVPGFKPEPGLSVPTHVQRGRFIMRNNGLDDKQARASVIKLEEMQESINEYVARLCPATYVSGSGFAHSYPRRGDLLRFKSHFDALIADLLNVHR